MDFPISVPSVGLVGGKFVDEDPLVGTPGSLIPAQWGNAVTEEILNVIAAAGLVPNEALNSQLLAAIRSITNGRLLGAPKTFFTAGAATYVPTPGTKFAIVLAVSGGGAGGGTVVTAAGQASVGSGGASGSYWHGVLTAAQIGASLALTLGAGGTATVGGNGGNGGATSLGSYVSIPGGLGGLAGGAISSTGTGLSFPGSPGGPPTTNTVTTITQGNGTSGGLGIFTPSGVAGGVGAGSAVAGGAGAGRTIGAGNNGINATAPGASGSGAAQGASGPALFGGNGGAGMFMIYEYGNP